MSQIDASKKGVTIGVQTEEKQEKVTQIEDREFSNEETTSQLRLNEEDFLQGLLEAANYSDDKEQTAEIEIIRPSKAGEKKVLFRFRVRALSEREYNKCKKKYTKYVRNKSLGVKMPEDTDNVKYRAAIIYEATMPEDRNNLWDNRQAWDALRSKGKQIMNGLDVIEECLKAGEKDRVIDVIDQLSGYDDNLEEVSNGLENTIKN